MLKVDTTVETTINVPKMPLYKWLVPGVFDTELDTVLKDSPGFAGVTHTTGTTGPWDVPGSTRIVHLSDGTSSRETVVAADTPDYFAYRLTEFSSRMLKLLVSEAGGEWWFTDAPGGTHVKWTYSATAQNILTVPLLYPVLKIFWNKSMAAGLDRVKRRAESELKATT